MLDVVQVKFVGAHSDLGWDINKGITDYYPSVHRYFYGTQSAALYAGLLESIEFHNKIGVEVVEKRCKELANHLYEGTLDMKEKVTMLSSSNPINRGGIIGFKFKEKTSLEFYEFVKKEGYKIRTVAESDLHSIRISTHVYNSMEEVDGLLDLMRKF